MTVTDQPTYNSSFEQPTGQPNPSPASRLPPTADVGGLIAGAVFTVVGVLFLLEAGEVWTFALSDLRYFAPLALIVIGVSVLIGGLTRADADAEVA